MADVDERNILKTHRFTGIHLKSLVSRHISAALLISALICGAVNARVFLRSGPVSDVGTLMDRMKGSLVYQAAVDVNGEPGSVTFYSIDAGFERTVLTIEKRTGVQMVSGESMASCTLRGDSSVSRLLLLQVQRSPTTLVIAFKRSPSTRGHPRAGINGYPWLTSLPGLQPVFDMQNRDTGTGLAVSRTTLSPADTTERVASALRADGWRPVYASAGTLGKTMNAFLKSDGICYVLTENIEDSGDTRVTLLKKRLDRAPRSPR
jgi:hypothetical protein